MTQEDKDDIREYLFNKYFDTSKNEERSLFDKAYNELQPTRHYVADEEELDKADIFDTDIDAVIEYLEILKNKGAISLSEEWSRYKNNYIVANYPSRLETDKEYASRIYASICPLIRIYRGKTKGMNSTNIGKAKKSAANQP